MKDERIHTHTHDQQGIQAMVDYQGFALFHGANPSVEWTSTIGLARTEAQSPEFLISGGSKLFRINWLLSFGFEVNGPPSPSALRDEARARGIPVRELYYPSGGKVYEPGRIYRMARARSVLCCLGEVEKQYYESFLRHAVAFHREANFPTFQIVVSNEVGDFPWNEGATSELWRKQRLLFAPQRYLPLKEEE